MKRRLLILLLTIILVLPLSATLQANDYYKYNEELRIGLKTYYQNQSAINVYNRSLVIGYVSDGDYVRNHEITTSGHYRFETCINGFLISIPFYNSFDESMVEVAKIRDLGYKAYVGSAANGIWKVYVGYTTDTEALNNMYNALNGLNDITYEIVSDNGLRTMVFYDESYPIIFENTSSYPEFMTNDSDGTASVLDLGKRSYRGRIEMNRFGDKGISAVNIIDIDQYLYGVIPGEMPVQWPMEALKSQAVAARSYAIYNGFEYPKYPNKPFDLDDTISSQVYKGYGVETTRGNQAVDETAKQLIYYKDSVIAAFFYSTSGGHTESSNNVWSGSVSYLQGKPDIYETSPEMKPWIKTYTAQYFMDKLKDKGHDIGSLTSITVDTKETGRVYSMTFNGTAGSYTVEKETIRYWFGMYSRKFELITPEYVPDTKVNVEGGSGVSSEVSLYDCYVIKGSGEVEKLSTSNEQVITISPENIDNIPLIYGRGSEFTLVGMGHGHGVGMSQSGAKGMAFEGFSYIEILEYYYTGTTVK